MLVLLRGKRLRGLGGCSDARRNDGRGVEFSLLLNLSKSLRRTAGAGSRQPLPGGNRLKSGIGFTLDAWPAEPVCFATADGYSERLRPASLRRRAGLKSTGRMLWLTCFSTSSSFPTTRSPPRSPVGTKAVSRHRKCGNPGEPDEGAPVLPHLLRHRPHRPVVHDRVADRLHHAADALGTGVGGLLARHPGLFNALN